MNKFLLALCFVVSASVHAEQWELDLANPNAGKDLDKIINYIETYGDDYSLFDTGNGEYYFTDYDAKSFDVTVEQEKLQASYPNDGDTYGDCMYEDLAPAQDLSAIIALELQVYDSEAVDALEKMEKTGMVEAVLGRVWDGASGDSEYCLREAYRVYLKNGKVLNLNYDHTD